jgi:hypothetical protein
MHESEFEMSVPPDVAPWQSCNRQVASHQISVKEMLFVVTLAASAVGTYIYLSQTLVLLVGAVLMLSALTSWAAPHNPILGAIRGFIVAIIIAIPLILVSSENRLHNVGIIVLIPPLGYCLGFLNSELSQAE